MYLASVKFVQFCVTFFFAMCAGQCDVLCIVKCISVMWNCAELCSVEVCIVVQLAQVIPKNTQQCAVCSIVCRVVDCAASAGYSLMFPISRIATLCHSVNWTAHSALNFCFTFLSFLIVPISSLLLCSFCLFSPDIIDPVGNSVTGIIKMRPPLQA